MSEATKVEHRERLLAAAAAEFAARGVSGARVDDISLAAGLAKGTIYNYFESKEHIFREVLASWWARVAASRANVPEEAAISAKLLALIQANVAVISEQEDFARTAFREVLLAEAAETGSLLPAFDPLDEALAEIMREGQDRGELRTDRPAATMVVLLAAAVNGLLFERWVSGGNVALADIPRLSVELFMQGSATT